MFKQDRFAYASRVEPMFPFEYMKIIWLYRELPDGVQMTWIQDFKMDEKAKYNDEQVEDLINKHSTENLKRFKDIIERS